MSRWPALVALGLGVFLAGGAAAQTPPPTTPPPVQSPPLPVPLPFPTVGQPTGQPTDPAAQVPAGEAGELMLGNAPIYPAAEFLEEFDAGRGQRFYIYGTNLPYQDIVDYYKARLRNHGREIFETPATQQFELGRFDDKTMAFPPSVVVKDYGWSGSEGYLVVDGTTERRFMTIIQILPGSGGG